MMEESKRNRWLVYAVRKHSTGEKKVLHLEHNNVLCSSLGRDDGICCGSYLQTSALVEERKEKILSLQHKKVDGKTRKD